MSHAAVYTELSFWFVVGLTLLLVTFVGVVVRTPHGTVGSPQPSELNHPAPLPPAPLLPEWAQALRLAGTTVTSAGAIPRPRQARAPEPELMVVGGPPWDPAPKPPGLPGSGIAHWLALSAQVPDPRRPAAIAAARIPSGVRAGAHRQAPRHSAHRATPSSGQARRSAGRTGRHRAGTH